MKTRLVNEDLARLAELERQATPGPWRARREIWEGEERWANVESDDGDVLAEAMGYDLFRENAAVIVAARNALRPLLDEVARLRARQVEILRRAQQAESALREKVRAVAGPHDSRGLGRRMLGGVLTMVEADVERLRDVLSRLVERADPSGPTSSELLQEARRVVEETGTNPVERATDHFRRGEEQAIADVIAYLREDPERGYTAAVVIEALERGDHEGAARRAGGRS